jgi:hypothetical protein
MCPEAFFTQRFLVGPPLPGALFNPKKGVMKWPAAAISRAEFGALVNVAS